MQPLLFPFSSLLPTRSFPLYVTVILELIGLKKPAFRRHFTQMTANVVRLFFKKSARYILYVIRNK